MRLVPLASAVAVAGIVAYTQGLVWQVSCVGGLGWGGAGWSRALRGWVGLDGRTCFGCYCCCVVPLGSHTPTPCCCFQGLWQDIVTDRLLGGGLNPELLSDPAGMEDSLRGSLGSLVGAPNLMPRFLLAPTAAVVTGLLEAAWFSVQVFAKEKNAEMLT